MACPLKGLHHRPMVRKTCIKWIKSPPAVLIYMVIIACAGLLALLAAAEIFHWVLMR
jgi:hypothetical protein